MKGWHVYTKTEGRRREWVGLDMCWVRGWVHTKVDTEPATNIVATQNAKNNLRVSQTGSDCGGVWQRFLVRR